MGVVADTNVYLHNLHILDEYDNLVYLSHVNRELEKHKSRVGELGYLARKATRYVEDNKDRFLFDLVDYSVELDDLDPTYEDNRILSACIKNQYKLLTEDIALKHKAKCYGVEIVEFSNKATDDNYTGYKEIEMTTDELSDVYSNLDINRWDLLENEYLIPVDPITGEDIDGFRWDGQTLHRVHQKGFTTQSFGKFKPRDNFQKAAIDSIMNNELTMLKGKAGSGKSLITLNTAWHLIERGKFDQLIIFTNPVKTKNAEALGFYKGTRTEKLLDSQIGIMLSSKFGDIHAVQSEISSGRLQLLPFSDIRGFDTTGEKRVITWITEAQNTNSELMKLALQRIGGNTKGIIDGDPRTQVDMDAYNYSNGMNRASEVFRGRDVYGEVELKHIYRSKIAEIADQM